MIEPDTIVVNDPYVACPSCRASGHQDGLYGIETCSTCKGDCVVRDRDAKGRFITHPRTMYRVGDNLYSVRPQRHDRTNQDSEGKT